MMRRPSSYVRSFVKKGAAKSFWVVVVVVVVIQHWGETQKRINFN